MKKFIFILAIVFSQVAYAGPHWQEGTITNLTSIKGGLLIMLDGGAGLPDNCVGTPYGWMLISEADKAMTATALTMWATGNRTATVYTNAYTGSGFCEIHQLDPVG